MEPIRIALVGPAGSGKTTHARLLQKALKGDVLSFATPLKKVTSELFGDGMEDPTYARKANQELGVAVRRIDTNTWVRLLLAKVPESRNCFVDDCRFANEWVALDQLGFRFIRLFAHPDELHRRRPSMTPEQWQHESEIESQAIVCERLFSTDGADPEEVNQLIRTYLRETPRHAFPRASTGTLYSLPQ